jgi:hypothetical protein
MFNEKVANNFEGAAIIARRTPLGETTAVGFDCANYLQELADRVRKEDHELTAPELAELAGSYKSMLFCGIE